ncbi:MAG: 30S ribosomal protein S8 [Chloroflexi bacterium]|nr:30S ribosomal protein S8 [Chloroflexota bacterium]
MPVTDPIADMLTRLRNALMLRRDTVAMPSSSMKVAIAVVLKAEGFLREYEVVEGEGQKVLKLYPGYRGREPVMRGVRRISKPGLRVYVQRKELPRTMGGVGVSIVSTPQGVMTGKDAWHKGLGGEVLCAIW